MYAGHTGHCSEMTQICLAKPCYARDDKNACHCDSNIQACGRPVASLHPEEENRKGGGGEGTSFQLTEPRPGAGQCMCSKTLERIQGCPHLPETTLKRPGSRPSFRN